MPMITLNIKQNSNQGVKKDCVNIACSRNITQEKKDTLQSELQTLIDNLHVTVAPSGIQTGNNASDHIELFINNKQVMSRPFDNQSFAEDLHKLLEKQARLEVAKNAWALAQLEQGIPDSAGNPQTCNLPQGIIEHISTFFNREDAVRKGAFAIAIAKAIGKQQVDKKRSHEDRDDEPVSKLARQ